MVVLRGLPRVFGLSTLTKSEKQVFMQESGCRSGLISKDKEYKNLPVSPFLPGANLRVDH